MLIKCPECMKEISDKAERCPHCGYPIKIIEIKSSIKMEVYTVEDIQKILGINKNKSYELAMSGSFPAKKLGRRILIPKKPFDEWLYNIDSNSGEL